MSASPDGLDNRALWLQNTLIEDHYTLLVRTPSQVEGKFAKMADNPYNFFRGTVPQYYRDVTQPSEGFAPTNYGSAQAAYILLVGDPHPENIGTYFPADGALTLDFNDFDGSRYGPFHFDVRRLALGFYVATTLAIDAGFADDAIRQLAVTRVVEGYVAELDGQARGEAPLRVTYQGGFGTIIDDLMRRALRDGPIFRELSDSSCVYQNNPGCPPNTRCLVLFDPAPPLPETGFYEGVELNACGTGFSEFDVVVPLNDEETRLVTEIAARYPTSTVAYQNPASRNLTDRDLAFTLKSAGRRLGGGVSSYPLYRFYLLFEGPTTSQDDDWLIEVRETQDGAFIPGLPQFPPRLYRNNAERVIDVSRRLHTTPTNDTLAGWASLGAFSFRARHRTRYQRSFSTGRMLRELASGDFAPEDLPAFAFIAGRLLARSHTNAPTQQNDDALSVIRDAIGGDNAGFASETLTFALSYGPVIIEDHQRLQQLRAIEGPLLDPPIRYSNERSR